MAYDIPVMNGTGVDEVVADVALAVPVFTPMFLFFIFGVTFITLYNKQKERSGFGDTPLCATIGGVITSIVALLMSTVPGIINILTLSITFVLTILAAIWLFSSKDRI